MRAALVQMTSSDQPTENIGLVKDAFAKAAASGARFVLTPEATNCVSASRTHQQAVLCHEEEDPTLGTVRNLAAQHGCWALVGSLALKTKDGDGRFANRSFLIDPSGSIVARYDKIHMFDVEVSETETYRESAGYRPGANAVLAETPFGKVGMTICYDIRFPHLYRNLAQSGAQVLTVPSAFSPVTGAAHWEPLLRARAIETGCYVLAPAQTGSHPTSRGKPRNTYGHAMAISPWGEILAGVGEEPGICYVDLDMDQVAQARQRIPSLCHDVPFEGP